jgi:hypothetical protein
VEEKMLTVIKRLYIVYMIFLGLLIGYILLSNGLDPLMIKVIFDVSFIFVIVAVIMYLMGKPPRDIECVEKFRNATIDEGVVINRRKLRRWVSCSVCIDSSDLVVCTFRKVRESVKREDILEIYKEGATIVVEFPGKKWYLSVGDVDKVLERLQRFLKNDES